MKALCMLALPFILAPSALSQTIENDGFELPAIDGGQWKENIPGYGWVFNASSGIANGASAWGHGGHGGSQYAFIQSAGEGIGMMCERITGLVPGRRYSVSFWMARRDTPIGPIQGANVGAPIEILEDNDVILSFVTPGADGQWRRYRTRSFVATTRGISLIFMAQKCYRDQASLIDDVVLQEVHIDNR